MCLQLSVRLTDAGVSSVDVGELEAVVTFTQEAPKRVHTLPVTRTHAAAQRTLVDVCREGEEEVELHVGQRFILHLRRNRLTDRYRCVCLVPAVTLGTDRCIGPPPS